MSKRESTLSKLSLWEKAKLCTGNGNWHTKGIRRLGLPALTMTDGPSGLHPLKGITKQATCFPSSSAAANSWDPEVTRAIGDAIGEEALRQGISVILGPGVNMKRSPLCGRNFEYYSEDPCLAGEMACGFVEGLQNRGVGACLKHFAANNQEENRLGVDVRVSERALRELYLAAFETVVKRAKPWSVMCAYNSLNGDFCSENHWLLTKVLREDWGYEGVLMTDWNACHDRVKGLLAGQDLTMPSFSPKRSMEIARAVRTGRVPLAVLDRSAGRMVELLKKGKENLHSGTGYCPQEHHALARRLAAQCAVLLKNEGGLLPLDAGEKVALMGELAKRPRFQGGGCAYVTPGTLENAYDWMLRRQVPFVYEQGYSLEGNGDDVFLESALQTAAHAQKIILFLGLPDSAEVEGRDRTDLRLPQNQTRLLRALSRVNPNLIVVLATGAPVELPWLEDVGALVSLGLSGEGSGAAAVDVLYGDVNPSGKLAETFPMALRDTPGYGQAPVDASYVNYTEGVEIGYRYYDARDMAVRFPFGFGLSYTEFSYSGLSLNRERMREGETLTVRFTVKNCGERDGAEVAQLYVADEKSRGFRPPKELKGFRKVFLKAGESREVTLCLSRRAFAYYDEGRGDWTVEHGPFSILVGASSRDIRLRGVVRVEP